MSRRQVRTCLILILVLAAIGPAYPASVKRLLLIGQGPDGHPTGTHEYRPGLRILDALLAPREGIETSVIDADLPGLHDRLQNADGVVLFLAEGARWIQEDRRRFEAFQKLAQRGGGLVALHWAMGTKEAGPIANFVGLFGACHGGPDRAYADVPTILRPASPQHPITRGILPFPVRDEFYYRLKFASSAAPHAPQPLLTAMIDDQLWPVAWAWIRPGGGRSFGFSGLHHHRNWRVEAYRRLVVQGVVWAIGGEVPESGLDVDLPDELLPREPASE